MVKIGLGTVQLGLPYGNESDQPLMPEQEAFSILQCAVDNGVDFFDTAIGYGKSEERLGMFELAQKSSEQAISTKIPRVEDGCWKNPSLYFEFVKTQLMESKKRLKIQSFYLLQFHQSTVDFLESPSVQEVFLRLVEEGHCRKIGISVYEPKEAEAALNIPMVQALQVPVHLVDQRFVSKKFLSLYREKSIFLIARSILFQGVLVDSAKLPPVLKKRELEELRKMCQKIALDQGMSLYEMALSFIFLNLKEILHKALIGIQDKKSLTENLSQISLLKNKVEEETLLSFGKIQEYALSKSILSPALWNR